MPDFHAAESAGEADREREVVPRAAVVHPRFELLVARDAGEPQGVLRAEIGNRPERDRLVVSGQMDLPVGACLIDHAVDHLHFAVKPVHRRDRQVAEPFDLADADDPVIVSAQQNAEQRNLGELSVFSVHYHVPPKIIPG